MPVTLAQAQAPQNAVDDVDVSVIDEFRTNQILDLLTFDDVVNPVGVGGTLTYGYRRLATLGTTTDHTALSDRAVSYLRTIVPTIWGALVVTVLRVLGPHLPGDVGTALGDVLSSELVLTLVVTVGIAAWYWLWRRLERHVPDWLVRLVLGSARTPGYALTPADKTPDGGPHRRAAPSP